MQELKEPTMQDTDKSISEIESLYPERDLPSEAIVTRVAPSPTGFAHLGFVYMSLICQQVAENTGGAFIFRLEDTDQKREVEGSDKRLREALEALDIQYDEGIIGDNKEKGEYGPYKQTERIPIYKAYVDDLIKKGMAYPCFMTENELSSIREQQIENKAKPGIYGTYSKWRNAPKEQVDEFLSRNIPYVIRFKWPEGEEEITHFDLSGTRYSFKSQDVAEDFVLLKSNGIPTYHLAHLVDDHLMKVNLVIRGNEWVNSLPKHILLHKALGFNAPRYYHVPPIEILDTETGGRRKLSKRKDPEANIFNLLKDGFPKEAIKAYLLWLSTSEYEKETLKQNKPIIPDFKLNVSMLKSGAGSLFDANRLRNLSREVITATSPENLSSEVLQWSQKYATPFYEIISKYPAEYLVEVLKTVNNPTTNRKDLIQYADIQEKIGFLYDEIYQNQQYDITAIQDIGLETVSAILKEFLATYNTKDSLDEFLQKMKDNATRHGLALNKKDLQNGNYQGLWSVVPAIVRIAIAKKNVSPELHECIKILGYEKLTNRAENLLAFLKMRNG